MSIPSRIGKFEILRCLGKGAMGEVFLGRDTVLGREVAIKTILANPSFGEEARSRFEREAQATARLNHPNIVTVYDFGEDQGIHYLAMEYLEGVDLEALIQRKELSRTDELEVLAQVCEGLAFAHRQGIIHRDVKPSNILVIRHGARITAKLMDFGVALVSQSNLTQEGIWMGTANYMAPEYLDTGKASASSDLFAVGVMLYEVVSGGRKPFGGETTTLVLNAILRNPPAPFRPEEIHDVDPRLLEIVRTALAKNPDDRFPSAEALADAIRSIGRGRPASTEAPAAPPSPARRETEKPLIVGRGGRATCLSLRVALRQARPGARIVVLPGLYRESLVIEQDVTLSGEGETGEVVLAAPICLKAGLVRIQGMTLEKTAQEGSDILPAVVVQAGRATLEDCELAVPCGPAVQVEGQGTQVLMQRCHLHGNPSFGLDVREGASASVSECLLEGHTQAGVRAGEGATATLQRTVVKDGAGVGLRVQTQGQIQLEDCEILACAAGGVEVEREGRASLQRCRLITSQFAGILAMEKGQATLESCEISGHGASGVHVTEGAVGSLRQCRLHGNPGFGASIMDQGLCTLADCEIEGNGNPGVFVHRGGTIQVKDSKLHDGRSLGIVCMAQGRGVLEGCEIFGNAQSGAKVAKGGSLLLIRCVLRDGRDSGMLLFEDAELTLEECVVHRNARGGILLAKDASDPILRGSNRIEDDLLRTNAQGGLVKLAPVRPR